LASAGSGFPTAVLACCAIVVAEAWVGSWCAQLAKGSELGAVTPPVDVTIGLNSDRLVAVAIAVPRSNPNSGGYVGKGSFRIGRSQTNKLAVH